MVFMKTCNRCHIKKDDSEFRTRREARKGNPFDYLNNECKQCDKERATIYYNKKKDDPAFKEKNRRRARNYTESNPDKVKMRRSTKEYAKKHAEWALNRYYRMKDIVAAKMKLKRQTPEYKAKMKAYRQKRKEIIHSQEVVTKRRYHEKHRDSVTDEYIIRQLITQGLATREMLEQSENYQIIEAKRLQILIKRKIKNHGDDNAD